MGDLTTISRPAGAFPPLASVSGARLANTSETRTAAAARELEQTFLSLLLKEMRQTLEPDGGLFAGDTGDVQGGLFDLYMSQHLSAAGGVGLATAIETHLRPATHAGTPQPKPDATRRPAA